MSDQVSILVTQNRNVVGRFFYYYLLLFLSGSLLENIVSYHYLLIIWQKKIYLDMMSKQS